MPKNYVSFMLLPLALCSGIIIMTHVYSDQYTTTEIPMKLQQPDNQAMLDDILAWPEKLRAGRNVARQACAVYETKLAQPIRKLAILGMGGSGVSGHLIATLIHRSTSIQVTVVDTMIVPGHVDENTFVIALSYSGNTWETLTALETCIQRGCTVFTVSHGGAMSCMAQKQNLMYAQLPASLTPRSALGLFLGFLLTLLDEGCHLLKTAAMLDRWEHMAQDMLSTMQTPDFCQSFLDMATDQEHFHIWGFAGDSAPATYRMQTQFNENSKVRATYSLLPELCHNLIVGFTKPIQRSLVVMAHSDFLPDNLKIVGQFVEKLLTEKGALLYKVPVFGNTFGEQLLSLMLWADAASYHLGVVRDVEVTPVILIDSLKQQLQEAGVTKK